MAFGHPDVIIALYNVHEAYRRKKYWEFSSLFWLVLPNIHLKLVEHHLRLQ